MRDDFLENTIDHLEKQLTPQKKTVINIIKRKKQNETVVKDISKKIEAVKVMEPEVQKDPEPEIKQATKVIPWL